jgi:hypothetical protein
MTPAVPPGPVLAGAGARRPALAEAARTALLAAAAFLLLLVCFSPSWVTFRAWRRAPETFGLLVEVRRGESVLAQAADPAAEVVDPLHRIVRWRLLVPVVAHLLHLPAGATLGLAHLGCLGVLAFVVGLARRRGLPGAPGGERTRLSAGEAVALAVVLGAGGWFFTSVGWLGFYDSLLVLALLVTAWGPARWAVAGACILGPWVDERFLLGFPAALLVRGMDGAPRAAREGAWWAREAVVPALLVAAYAALRVGLLGSHGSPGLGAYASHVAFGRLGPERLALGAWAGLRVGWVVILAGCAGLWAKGRRRAAAVVAATAVATALVGLATSNDLSRSMMLLVPLVPLGWGFARHAALWERSRARLWLAAAALLLPAQHVVSDFDRPVRGLGYELAQLREPPPELSATTYLGEAGRAMARGDLQEAERMAFLAVRLAPGVAEAHNTLGVVLARAGDYRRAEAEMQAAMRLDPATPSYRDNLERLRALSRSPARSPGAGGAGAPRPPPP